MRKLFLFTLTFLLAFAVQAQFFLGGLHFNGSTAVGKLKQEAGSVFFPSVSGLILYEFQTAPIQFGLELGYGIYGSKLEKRNDLFPGFNDELRLRRNNNIASGMITMRYLPLVNAKYTPFVEAQFGANYLYTRYKIRAAIDEEAFEVGTDLSDWTLAYRIGGGIQIPLAFFNEGTKLEIKANYQDSNSIQFLTRGDVNYLPDQGDGEFSYNVKRGPMQLLTFSIGVIVYDLFY